jgi:uncharacterized protein (TIGR02117 family)
MARFFLYLLLLCLFSGCSTLPPSIKPGPGTSDTDNNNLIFVLNHGWHTGVVVPAHALTNKLPELRQRFPDSKYLEIGWGDEGFYQAEEITSGLTISAAFWPTAAVLHIVSIPASPEKLFPQSRVFRLPISDDELSHLLKFISSSFYFNQKKALTPLQSGLYGDSQFYRAVGDFYLFNTCNTWTAKALESSGFNLPDDVLILTAEEVMQFLANISGK